MKMPRVALVTLGCAKNLVDSERILGALGEAGALICEDPADAEIVLVNTCGFIAPAREESLAAIRELAKLKKGGRCRKLVVVGCLAQRYGAQLRREAPEADACVGVGDIEGILDACGVGGHDYRPDEFGPRLRLTPTHYAYLRISEGCDNRCSYCVIPAIRGPLRSFPPEKILAEAEALVAHGARELNVIGQDTSAYGMETGNRFGLAELLRKLSHIPELRWLRVLYCHPAHVTDDLIEELATNPKVCRYVDLPLQHLHDDILAQMKRRVTQSDILRLIEKIRERVKGVVIRTTLIVGFPGETEAAFEEMLALVQQLQFDRLGAFIYSREEGTEAAELPVQVPEKVKRARFHALMRVQQEVAFRKNRARVGREEEIVVDGFSEEHDAWVGRSFAEAPEVDPVILLRGEAWQPGEFARVRIVSTRGYDLVAGSDEASRSKAEHV